MRMEERQTFARACARRWQWAMGAIDGNNSGANGGRSMEREVVSF